MSAGSGYVPDPARRRNALLLGLQEVLAPPQVQAALRLWDEQYAQTREAALSEFVARLAAQLGHDARKTHALRIAVYSAIARHDVRQGGALPASAPAITRQAPMLPPQASPDEKRSASAAFIVFSHMAGTVLQGIQKEGRAMQDELASALARSGSIEGVDNAHSIALVRWARTADHGELQVLAPLPSHRFAPLMHALYVAAVEAAGPIAADRLLSRAAQQAENLAEAGQFPPRALL